MMKLKGTWPQWFNQRRSGLIWHPFVDALFPMPTLVVESNGQEDVRGLGAEGRWKQFMKPGSEERQGV
jgi:hypothetical protein